MPLYQWVVKERLDGKFTRLTFGLPHGVKRSVIVENPWAFDCDIERIGNALVLGYLADVAEGAWVQYANA